MDRQVGARSRTALQSAILAAGCMIAAPAAQAVAQSESVEYAVKAAYLYKFGSYVEWPPVVFATPNSPVNLCIAGEDPFGPAMDDAVRGQRIGSRPIVVRRLKRVEPNSGCHILYLGSGSMQDVAQNLDAIRGNGVLTVSDVPGLGIINFVIQDDRVRFDIDEEAAARNGLRISSKLLGLAVKVRPRQSGER